MARKPKDAQEAPEDIAAEAQDAPVESQVDETLGMDAQPVDAAPSLAEQLNFGDDERWKDYREINDPIELARKFKEQVETEGERFERQVAERQRQWQQTVTNDPQWIQYQRHQQDIASRQPEAEQDPLADFWKPPTVNRELVEMWTENQPVKDEAGNVVGYEPGWKKNAPKELVDAVEQYDLYRQKWRSEFHSDPRGKLMPLVEHTARKIAQEQFNTFAQQYDEQQFFDKFGDVEGPNGKWLFAHDANQQVVTGLSGEPVLSQLGQKLFADANALYIEAGGRLSKKRATQMAHKALIGEIALSKQQQAAETAASKETHESERTEALAQGAKRRPSRAGSVGKPENPNRPSQATSFRDSLRLDMDAKGITDEALQAAI